MNRILAVRLVGLILTSLLAACEAPGGVPARESAVDRAGAEATAIIEKAQATAVVLQAQTEATALVARAAQIPVTATRAPAARATAGGPAGAAALENQQTDGATPQPPETAGGAGVVEIIRVGFAVDGGFIDIQFKAPKEVAQRWWQGMVYVVDETTGVSYKEIPVMPNLGPLLTKPQLPGQVGHAMLVNAPSPLKSGALLTVVLGEYRFEHVPIK